MSRLGLAEVLLGFACLLGSAALAELYLRRFNPIDSILYEMHPRYLYRLVPGSRRLSFLTPANGSPATVLVTVNQAGFRGPEIVPRKAGLRFIVYGDSFVMAPLSEMKETFPRRLEKKLAAALQLPVEAINAGVAGYGPDQSGLRMEDEIEPLRPDLVIVAIYAGNDFGDLVRNKIYRLEPDGRLALNDYRLSRFQVREFPDNPSQVPSSMLVRGLVRLFDRPEVTGPAKVREMGKDPPEPNLAIYLKKRRAEYEDAVLQGNTRVRDLFADTYDADVSLTPDAPSALHAVALMEQVLVHIADLGASHGIRMLFVFIPAGVDVCQGPRYSGWARAASAYPGYRREGLTTVLAHIAERHRLEYLDLFPSFEAAGAASLYFPADGHWNAAGQELAAELAKERIIGHRLMGGTP